MVHHAVCSLHINTTSVIPLVMRVHSHVLQISPRTPPRIQPRCNKLRHIGLTRDGFSTGDLVILWSSQFTGIPCHLGIQQSDDTWLYPNMGTSTLSLQILYLCTLNTIVSQLNHKLLFEMDQNQVTAPIPSNCCMMSSVSEPNWWSKSISSRSSIPNTSQTWAI